MEGKIKASCIIQYLTVTNNSNIHIEMSVFLWTIYGRRQGVGYSLEHWHDKNIYKADDQIKIIMI